MVALIDHIKLMIRIKKSQIKFYHSEIACMVRLREMQNQGIKDYCRYFITLFTANIEDLTQEIENDRREITEIEGLSGAGSGDKLTGNAPSPGEADGRPV
jgi:hypothetical protein